MTIPTGVTREELVRLAEGSGFSLLDLSLGVPTDPPPQVRAWHADRVHGYPPSAGTEELRTAARNYLIRRFGVRVATEAVAACLGAKEFIGTLPLYLRSLRGAADRDVVLIPGLGYPSYGFGAQLAGLQAHRVPLDGESRMRLDLLPDDIVARALLVWVNSPCNPTGVLEELGVITDWGRANGVVVASDEAYAETTWTGDMRSILQNGADGMLCVHSMSKRSNFPGLRVGFYAGDQALVTGLARLRRETGLIASRAAQDGAAALLADDGHAVLQRDRNRIRLSGLIDALHAHGFRCAKPAGGIFAWVSAPGGDGDLFARQVASRAGVVVRPGGEYGPTGVGYVRVAAVRDVAEVATRLDIACRGPGPQIRTRPRTPAKWRLSHASS